MSIGDLSSKLKEKIDQDRQTLEKIASEEFEIFQKSLNASLQSALDTTANAIATQLQPWNRKIAGQLQELENRNTMFHKTIARSCFQTAMLGLLLMLGITLGAWGLTEIMTNRISELREDISNLKSQQERLKMSVSIFQQKTWGLELLDSGNGRFILLPEGKTIKSGWTFKDQNALKLE